MFLSNSLRGRQCQTHSDVGPVTDVVRFAFVTASLRRWASGSDVSVTLKMKAILPSETSTDAH